MGLKARGSLRRAPFPPLKWSGYLWRGQDDLAAFAKFQLPRVVDQQAEQAVTIFVAASNGQSECPPGSEQSRAYQYLLDHQQHVAAAVSESIVAGYPALRESPDAAIELDDLRGLVALTIVHVLPASQDGLAFIGLEFACDWDEARGLGVLVHGQDVVRIGTAGAAYLPMA